MGTDDLRIADLPDPGLPAPLPQLSPWLDHLITPRRHVHAQRRGERNVLLVHYGNLLADLDGQMRWLASQLRIAIPEQTWPALVRAATFESMSRSADVLVPAAAILKSNAAFFRRGTSGAGREILSNQEIAAYHARAAQLAPADRLAWLHSPSPGAVNP